MNEFKIVMLGAGGVGKSALTMQFVHGSFIENYDPTVEDLYTKQISINNRTYILEILDTAGVEQFASMSDLYIRNGHGFILVYSITNSQSFDEIQGLQKKICRIKQSNKVPIVITGNKIDLDFDRKVSQDCCKDVICSSTSFMEVTAKNNFQVNSLFIELVRLMKVAPNKKSSKKFCKNCSIM